MAGEHDGGPAFPMDPGYEGKCQRCDLLLYSPPDHPGMTLRDYACIHLRIPQTGKDWLDAIIRQSQVNEFAGQVIGAIVVAQEDFDGWADRGWASRCAYEVADAMLKERADG